MNNEIIENMMCSVALFFDDDKEEVKVTPII